MNFLKDCIKEMKRIRWPNGKEGSKTFLTSMIFITITSLILFVLAIGLTAMWFELGLGIK